MKLRVLHAPLGLEDLGPWVARPDPVAFSSAQAPEPMVFRVDLPGGPGNAEEALDRMEGWLGRTRANLNSVPERVVMALRRAHGPASYDVTRLAGADAWLTVQLGAGAVDYGIGDKVRRALMGMLDAATRLAWVETRIEGQLLARTRIGLSGDVDTVVRALITPKDSVIHCRAVNAARESKERWLKILKSIVGVARKIAMFAANPAAAVAALPTAWQYIKRIIAEVRAL